MMYKIEGVSMFQIIQKSVDKITVNYIKSPEWSSKTNNQILDGLKDRIGESDYKLNIVSKLKRNNSGKLVSIVNES